MSDDRIGTWRANSRLARFALYSQRALVQVELTRIAEGGTLSDASKARAKRRVCSDVLSILGVRRSRSGASGEMSPRPRLVVANHRTALDIGVLMAELGGAFLSRADVAEWPVAGRLARHADTIFVDRDDKRSGARAIRAIRRRLEEKKTVIVFPEGTTHAGDEVREFKGGAFAALRGLDVEIVPVGLVYPPGTEFVTPGFVPHIRSLAARKSTPMHLRVGSPFQAHGKARQMAAHTREIIQDLVDESRQELKRSTE